jgi:hypothetical protein
LTNARINTRQPEELLGWLLQQNEALSQCDDARFLDSKASAAKVKALAKAREYVVF